MPQVEEMRFWVILFKKLFPDEFVFSGKYEQHMQKINLQINMDYWLNKSLEELQKNLLTK